MSSPFSSLTIVLICTMRSSQDPCGGFHPLTGSASCVAVLPEGVLSSVFSFLAAGLPRLDSVFTAAAGDSALRFVEVVFDAVGTDLRVFTAPNVGLPSISR